MTYLLSPTEDELTKMFGHEAITSSIPETKGADILDYTPVGLLGIQRKKVPHDFLSSFTDGRMSRLLPLLKSECKFALLIREGRFRYYPNTHVALDGRRESRFTKRQVYGMLNDIIFVGGVPVVDTESIEETVEFIRSVSYFMRKTKHTGLYSRPSAKGAWYVPTAREVDLWLLQSFQGIGVGMADAIVNHFGGRAPIKWDCTYEQLLSVPKLGKKRAKILYESLAGLSGIPVETDSVVDKLEELRKRLSR